MARLKGGIPRSQQPAGEEERLRLEWIDVSEAARCGATAPEMLVLPQSGLPSITQAVLSKKLIGVYASQRKGVTHELAVFLASG
ncbi:hypothetical protein ES708_18881 [subsurface metagenome]